MMAPANVLTTATISGLVFGPEPMLIFTSMVASLIPDIDNPESTISRRIPFIPGALNTIFGHRTLTHSLIFMGLFYFLFRVFWPELVNAWLLGMGVHLLLDLITEGCMLFWPLPVWMRICSFKTNGFVESLYVIFLLFANVRWLGTLWLTAGGKLFSGILSILPSPFLFF